MSNTRSDVSADIFAAPQPVCDASMSNMSVQNPRVNVGTTMLRKALDT